MTLCLFPSHEWRSLRVGAVSPEPAQCPTQSKGVSGEGRRRNSPGRGLETLALDQFYHDMTLDWSLPLCGPQFPHLYHEKLNRSLLSFRCSRHSVIPLGTALTPDPSPGCPLDEPFQGLCSFSCDPLCLDDHILFPLILLGLNVPF